MKSKIPGALAFGLLGVLALSACGGGATTASGAELTGTPVKLMSIAPQGTSVQNFPGLLAAAQASVRAINARGGIKGGKVELIYCNEKADAAAGEKCARDAVAQNVAAVVAYVAPQSADKIHAVLDPANIPVIAGTAVTKTDYTNPLSYSIDGGTTSEFAACGPALKVAGVTKTATVSLDLAASLALVPLTDTGVKGAGLTSTGVIVKIPITATDYAPYVQQLKDSGADGVTMILPSGQALQMLKTIRDQGSNIKVCTPDGTMKAPALTDLGDAASNVVNTGWIPLTTTSNPSVAEFIKDLKAEEDSGDANAALEGMLSSDQQGWVGPRIIERLSKTIDGDITGAKLIAALNASSSLNADQFGTIDFTKPGKLQPSLRNTEVYLTKWDTVTKQRALLQDGPVDVGAFL